MTHKDELARLSAAKGSVDFPFVATASSWEGESLLVRFCDKDGALLATVLVDDGLVVTEHGGDAG
jgi:hypothetical protein